MIEDSINKTAEELNLSPSIVKEVYKAYWFFIRETIKKIPLKKDLSKEDFSSFKTNINIPSIGKLYIDFNRYLGLKKKYNLRKSRQ